VHDSVERNLRNSDDLAQLDGAADVAVTGVELSEGLEQAPGK
jgi:hypothetical protein